MWTHLRLITPQFLQVATDLRVALSCLLIRSFYLGQPRTFVHTKACARYMHYTVGTQQQLISFQRLGVKGRSE